MKKRVSKNSDSSSQNILPTTSPASRSTFGRGYGESSEEAAYFSSAPLEPPAVKSNKNANHGGVPTRKKDGIAQMKKTAASRIPPTEKQIRYKNGQAAAADTPLAPEREKEMNGYRAVSNEPAKPSIRQHRPGEQQQQHSEPPMPVVAVAKAASREVSSQAIKMMKAFDYKQSERPVRSTGSRESDTDDRDLIAQKMPAGRSRAAIHHGGLSSRYNSSRSTAMSDASRRTVTSGDNNHDLRREKLPRSRPADYDPRRRQQLHPHETIETPVAEKKPRKKPVATAEAAIIEESASDQPLLWDPAVTHGNAATGTAKNFPVAHLAEPSSMGIVDPSTVGEISQSHVLPAGKDTVSSYHHPMAATTDEPPTRTAEASVLSYVTVSSYSEESSDFVVANPVNATAAPSPVKPYDKGYSPAFVQRQTHQAQVQHVREQRKQMQDQPMQREKQKIQLDEDLRARQKSSEQREREKARSDQTRAATPTTTRARRPETRGKRVSKIWEEDNEDEDDTARDDSETVTVTHRNVGPLQHVAGAPHSVKKQVRKDPMPQTPEEKKCCLFALLGG